MKAGIKTSEFWVTILGLGGLTFNFLQQNCNIDPEKVVAFAGIIITYVLSRAYLKGSMPTPPEIPSQPTSKEDSNVLQ